MVNPIIKKKEIVNVKPILSVLIDNSESSKFFNQGLDIDKIKKSINNNTNIREKFNVNHFSFGESLKVLDTLSFNENNTNISGAINSVNELHKNNKGAVLLITDGNQTYGNDYEFTLSSKKIFPLVIGDTTKYTDLKINQLNVNKYSFLKNKFPVEAMLYYEGNDIVTTNFSIFNKEKTVFSKRLTFSPSKKSQTILTNLEALKEGQNYYSASIKKLDSEKNIKNNTKNFSIEVIDQQTKVLIITSILHPDLGAFKKSIESNKQRSVDVVNVSDFKKQLNDYQLIILYQVNNKFNDVLLDLKKNNINYFVISGANTNWNFINKHRLGFSKNSISQTENFSAKYNSNFLSFFQKDIGFNQFPPLLDKYGEVIISKPHNTILFQRINGIETNQPLLSTFELNNQKSAVLFGEGIWKWRASSFVLNNSFQDFDEFMSNLIQYLASNKKRNRLEVKAESLYPSNSLINISAFYIDKNYKFDKRASLEITITNEKTKEVKSLPFSLINNSYQVEIENLFAGDYSYKVSVDKQNINKYGKFRITDFKIEEQFTNANHLKLEKLADRTGGKLYFPNEIDVFLDDLVKDKSFFITQKTITKEQNLIDWKWILFIIISLLTTEWFIRKYYGKI